MLRKRNLAVVALATAAAGVLAIGAAYSLGGRSAAPQAAGQVVSTRVPAPSAAGTATNVGRLPASQSSSPTIVLPTSNAPFDYQLGGPYTPAADVRVLARDRTESPAPGIYNICYVNGFQAQPDERSWWLANYPTLILRNVDNSPVIDPEWPDEYILDLSSVGKRALLEEIVGSWISQCATDGFNAVEIDNLDTFTRFPTRLTQADAVDLISRYAGRAHAVGLAIAQKNSPELALLRSSTRLDFAVAEQCGQYNECDSYTAGFGNSVFVIEYSRTVFLSVCASFPNLSVLYRDVALATPSVGSYRREAC
jgi:Glycoside-hydrolase family GH114